MHEKKKKKWCVREKVQENPLYLRAFFEKKRHAAVK